MQKMFGRFDLVNTENKVEDFFKVVNVKKACGNVAGSWWKITEKTFVTVEKKPAFVSWKIRNQIVMKILWTVIFLIIKNVF